MSRIPSLLDNEAARQIDIIVRKWLPRATTEEKVSLIYAATKATTQTIADARAVLKTLRAEGRILPSSHESLSTKLDTLERVYITDRMAKNSSTSVPNSAAPAPIAVTGGRGVPPTSRLLVTTAPVADTPDGGPIPAVQALASSTTGRGSGAPVVRPSSITNTSRSAASSSVATTASSVSSIAGGSGSPTSPNTPSCRPTKDQIRAIETAYLAMEELHNAMIAASEPKDMKIRPGGVAWTQGGGARKNKNSRKGRKQSGLSRRKTQRRK